LYLRRHVVRWDCNDFSALTRSSLPNVRRTASVTLHSRSRDSPHFAPLKSWMVLCSNISDRDSIIGSSTVTSVTLFTAATTHPPIPSQSPPLRSNSCNFLEISRIAGLGGSVVGG